jgi:hypothetical protein
VRRFLVAFLCLSAFAAGLVTAAAVPVPSAPPGRPASPSLGGLAGLVVDGLTGAPVAGALVSASSGPSAVTGTNGSYRLMIPNGSVTLTVTDAGYHPSSVTVIFHAGGPAVNITLAPFVFPVHGAVVDRSSSAGLSGIVVVANPGEFAATTGTTGTYRLNLENGTYAVTVSAPGYQTQNTTVVVDGAPVTLYLFLSPPPLPPTAAPPSPLPFVGYGLAVGASAATLGAYSARGVRERVRAFTPGPLASLPSWGAGMVRARVTRGRRSRLPPR